jgi:membrane protein DedA with SNARE-associated domain
MINNLISSLGHWITGSISQVGYPAVFLLMFLESALIPIPSEVTMPFAGFLAGQGFLNFWLVVLIGGLANLAGSLTAYALGYWGQERFVKKLIKKYGKYFLITYDEVETAEKWFRKRGELIAFGSRLLPVVRTFISLPAGFSQMNVIKFSAYSLAGALIWSAALTYLGLVFSENWNILETYFRKFDIFIVLFFLGVGAFYVHHKIKKLKNYEKEKANS